MQNRNLDNILNKLEQLYKKTPFSVGFHTTNKENAQQIIKIGLKTGVRALEGTIKFRGDFKSMNPKDFNYFFPYTDNTVIVFIPNDFDTPRIEDNQGGDTPLCEFSRFFERAQSSLSHYRNGIEGLLPNYYILGSYDKQFNLTLNLNCMIFNQDNYHKFNDDINKCSELSFIK